MPKQQRNVSAAAEDMKRSYDEWGALTSQVLKLKCNQYSLVSTGNKQSLQKRLFEHFHPMPVAQPTMDAAVETSTMAKVLEELKRLRTEVADIKNKNIRDGADTRAPHPPLLPTPAPTLHDKMPATYFNILDPPTTGPLFAVPSNPPNSCTSNIEPQTTNQIATDLANTAHLNNFTGTPTLSHSDYNPFTSPPIKASTMKKIGKEEYVDLDDILPAPPAINTDSFFGLEMDTNSSSLLLKENKPKVKIKDFASWICAWHLYTQAYLSVKPDMFYHLFCYS